ncbi:MAG: hypothetical protein EAZ95_08115 [Bacteroidetes bacterium]|nr:MAG: hypothetical protein EAZ95_08115 [Bacteroidota bacterium]
MMRLAYFGLFFWASLGIAQAQEPIFWVLYGQYQVGKTFLPSDTIKSKDDITPIILIAKTNGFVILREKGVWQASTLLSMLQKSAKNQPFPELYVGKINPARDKLLGFGSVERCMPPPITACLPIRGYVTGAQDITIKWLQNTKQNEAYSVRLMNSFDDVLQETFTKDTTATIFAKQFETDEDFFKLEICQCKSPISGGGHCSYPLVWAFFLLERPEQEALKKEYETLKNSLQTFSPALQHLHLACWLMKKECYIEASLACQEAQKLIPYSKVPYFLLGEWLAHHSYHYYALGVYPNWRFML